MATFADMTNAELRQASEEETADKAAEEAKSLSLQSTADSESESKIRAQPEGSPAGPPEDTWLGPGNGQDCKEFLGTKRKRAGDDKGEAPVADQGGLSTAKVVYEEQASCRSEATVRPKGSPKKLCPCDQCGRDFGRREHLARHIKTVHERGTEAKCDERLRTFSRYDNGIKHVVKCPIAGVPSNFIDLRQNAGAPATSARRLAGPQPRGWLNNPTWIQLPRKNSQAAGPRPTKRRRMPVDDRSRGTPYPGMIRFTPINQAL